MDTPDSPRGQEAQKNHQRTNDSLKPFNVLHVEYTEDTDAEGERKKNDAIREVANSPDDLDAAAWKRRTQVD